MIARSACRVCDKTGVVEDRRHQFGAFLHFEAPPAQRVHAEMDRFVAWLERNRVVAAGGEAWRWLAWVATDADGWPDPLPLETFGPIPGL